MRMRRPLMPTYVKGIGTRRPGENGSTILYTTPWKLRRENGTTVMTLLIRIRLLHFYRFIGLRMVHFWAKK